MAQFAEKEKTFLAFSVDNIGVCIERQFVVDDSAEVFVLLNTLNADTTDIEGGDICWFTAEINISISFVLFI